MKKKSICREKIFRENCKKIDIFSQIRYNEIMKRMDLAIIGGGASGLFLAVALQNKNLKTVLFERGERLGKKLSSTGNGQGNFTNVRVCETPYFSSCEKDALCAEKQIARYDDKKMRAELQNLGLLSIADERGRVYPAGRQASSITDVLRFSVEKSGIETRLSTQIIGLQKTSDGFILTAKTSEGEEKYFAKNVVLCAGGKAAKNFGTDGSAYALVKGFGHTVTPLFPSLVQLKTDTSHTKTLKGIRVNDGVVIAEWQGKQTVVKGDIIFTDYGVSGDAIFRISAFITDKLDANVTLYLDFLPDFTEEQVYASLLQKRKAFPELPLTECLGGTLNNQIGRAVLKRANGDFACASALVKRFPLQVLGALGFDYAQVTKGGIPLSETDENLQSRFAKGLYFAGEILDIDGACGGFNLQWAYSSAKTVAEAIGREYPEKR